MKALIVCTSVSHGNTKQVADAIGHALEAPVVTPDQVDRAELASCDLVGFGSGIYNRSFHEDLLSLVDSLEPTPGAKAFVFATSGFPDSGLTGFSSRLVKRLEGKGFDVVDTFSCRGHDTWFPFKPFGGTRKGRPNAADLETARTFAEGLQRRVDEGRSPARVASLPWTGSRGDCSLV